MLPTFPMEELLGATEETADEIEASWNQRSTLCQQTLGRLLFWQACVENASQVDYVQEHLFDIIRLDCRGVIFSTLCQKCILILSEESETGVTFSKNLVTLLMSMLKELEKQYQDMTLGPIFSKQRLRFGEAELYIGRERDYDMSWLHMEFAPQTHDDQIVCQMTEVYHRWTCLIQSLASREFVERGQIRLMGEDVEEVTSLIKRIIEPWDIHIGVRPIQSFLLSENYTFFELSAAGFIQNANAFDWRKKESSGGAEAPALVYDSAPNLRIVCTSRKSPKGWNGTSKEFKDSVVATHDLGPRITARLLEFLRIVTISYVQKTNPAKVFHGNWEEYLECQKLMVNDVWENVGEKLDAWQQLYLVACLKTRLRNTWFIPA
ncbi:hypothetical protein DL98DRAFT_208037 [Cadophora sp. DSE1049]|nr:hypothetical protein DL98DRAFT_208037 [Cadophora sp. DSE1049]